MQSPVAGERPVDSFFPVAQASVLPLTHPARRLHMATVTLKGSPVKLKGKLPQPGDKAPDATLVTGDLSEKHLSDFRGKAIVLNIFPSIDTGVCALQTKTFAQRLKGRDDVVAVFASMD